MGNVSIKTPAEKAEEHKASLVRYVKTKRTEIMAAGIDWNGNPVQTDAGSRSNIGDEAQAASAGTRPDPDTFRMANNSSVSLSNQEMIDMASAVRDHYKATYEKSWELMAGIEDGSITSEADIDGADWPPTL